MSKCIIDMLQECADKIIGEVKPSSGSFSDAMNAYGQALVIQAISSAMSRASDITDFERIEYAKANMDLTETFDRNGPRWDMRILSAPKPSGVREVVSLYVGPSLLSIQDHRWIIDNCILHSEGEYTPHAFQPIAVSHTKT